MANLAPFFYRNILEKDGGPIKEIIVSKARLSKNQTGFEAACYLSDMLKNTLPAENNQIYGNPDGSGSDNLKSQAIYKAISEALERWAFYSTIKNSNNCSLYGFNLDTSTNGMAAFPSFFNRSVKKIAYFEALERWALYEWWSGNLSSNTGKDGEINFLQICFDTGSVVICWRKISATIDNVAYGFAAEQSFKKAYNKAQIELFRNIFVLETFYKKNLLTDLEQLNLDIYEKRLIHFADKKGFDIFLENVRRSDELKAHVKHPTIILSKEIKGPWSKYTKVWRCVLEADFSLRNRDNHDIDLFIF